MRGRPLPLFVRRLAAGAGFVLAAAALGAAAGPARAQAPGLDAQSDEPVEIRADEGIEWRQEEKVYVARGNASATRAGVTVYAETLTARYQTTEDGGTDIWRIDADEDVRIVAEQGTAYGDRGVYDVHNGILVLRGNDLRLETERYVVTARDSLEYWETRRMAVARGDALVVQADRRLSAEVVTAHFASAPGGGETQSGGGEESRLQRIEAFGNVHISSPDQVARGERGVYHEETGIATLYGSVKITRDENQLNGEYGEVNLKTGVSRLLSGPPGEAGAKTRRVRGLFVPGKKPEIGPRGQEAEGGGAP